MTPLHRAVENGFLDIVEVLLTQGANPNIEDENEETPLELAINATYWSIIKLLLYYGANYQDFLDRFDELLEENPEDEEEIMSCLDDYPKKLAKRIYSKLKVLLQAKMGLENYFKIIDRIFPQRKRMITDQQLYEIITLVEKNKPSERYEGEFENLGDRYLSEKGKIILKAEKK
jgi:ankyrin repeat protein